MRLTLVRDETPAVQGESFQHWLSISQGVCAATARAYSQDVAREGLTEQSPEAAHERVAQQILGSGLAAATRSRRLASCARFFDYVYPSAQANPYRTVRRPRTGVQIPAVVTTPAQGRELVELFIAQGTLSGLMYAASAALMAGAGLRVGEVCSLTWGRLDLDAGRVRVTGKGDKTRDVPMGDFARTVLQRYHAAASERKVLAPSDCVVPVGERSIQRMISSVSERVQVSGLHPHALRHGFATAVQEQMGDLRLTADLLGHASVSTTQIYTHVADSRRQQAVQGVL